jgi:hypothetical protein
MVTGVVAIVVVLVLVLVCPNVNGFRVGGVTADFGKEQVSLFSDFIGFKLLEARSCV